MSNRRNAAGAKGHGFSLIELVIVVVIMGIIAAIAIPRLSRTARISKDKVLKRQLAQLREAIELYATEHGGKYPPITISIKKSLTHFTTINGDDSSVAHQRSLILLL